MDSKTTVNDFLGVLKEREKELNCLYMVDEILGQQQLTLPELFRKVIEVMPPAWRFPEHCHARIVCNGYSFHTPGFLTSSISVKSEIKADGRPIGLLEVVYSEDVPKTDEGYFLENERTLINTIADRIGQRVLYRQMKSVLSDWSQANKQPKEGSGGGSNDAWKIMLDFFRQGDHELLATICRKLTNYLLIKGVEEASEILSMTTTRGEDDEFYANTPALKEPIADIINVSERAFKLAERHLGSEEILVLVKKWIQEANSFALVKAIGNISPSLHDIIEQIRKFQNVLRGDELQFSPKERWLNVGLISHLLSDRHDYIDVAKQHISFKDFFDIINRIICPARSQGKLGGKGVGLFLAQRILANDSDNTPAFRDLKYPKTWYVTTDTITEFLHYNNLEELNEQKYKDIQEVRIEYPQVVRLIKNASLPPEIVRSLSVALDDFGDSPLIVRSSSSLEDQAGAAFSGKYKSLFLANQGGKKARLDALMNAILEVYASVFSPDPIQYRAERNLLDYHEEMGILIQEVVGKRAGKYYFPLFSGVAFSNNQYRWSPRVNREDGLLRIVPGLGTRAVDRLSDDFPVLISPGQPNIRVNSVPEEIWKYSPRKMDVINLEEGTFETVAVTDILRECGQQIDQVHKIVSILRDNHLLTPNRFDIDFKSDTLVVTMDGMVASTPFVKTIKAIMDKVKDKTGMPVDLEFAHDGDSLYLLQCRPQSSNDESKPAPIPKDIYENDIIFSAKRFIANGLLQNISHIVYVSADGYSSLTQLDDMRMVGKVVGRLNAILPKRQFILIGPGRWGSRGDIKLGVPVTYSDINNTAALLEVAVKKANYVPELSFGTHFFQDLVEADIRFIPLYPDDDDAIFNRHFFRRARNFLEEIFPEFGYLQDVVKVISVPDSSGGMTMSIAMNADLGEAMGYLTANVVQIPQDGKNTGFDNKNSDSSAWRWRFFMAEQLAARLDPQKYGVKKLYLIGSTSNGSAGPASDVDLLVHFQGNEQQQADLRKWFQGWSECLAELNFLKTGYTCDGLLDVHIITDEDIANKNPFAVHVDNIHEPAHELAMMNPEKVKS